MSAHLLDAIQGITTLKLFGRARDEIALIGRISEDYRRATMASLRVAFLTSAVLEFFSSLAIALVAVIFGARLLHGRADFFPAFLVLLLVPEFFLPLRTLATHYHARMSALAAAKRIFEIEDTARHTHARGARPRGRKGADRDRLPRPRRRLRARTKNYARDRLRISGRTDDGDRRTVGGGEVEPGGGDPRLHRARGGRGLGGRGAACRDRAGGVVARARLCAAGATDFRRHDRGEFAAGTEGGGRGRDARGVPEGDAARRGRGAAGGVRARGSARAGSVFRGARCRGWRWRAPSSRTRRS